MTPRMPALALALTVSLASVPAPAQDLTMPWLGAPVVVAPKTEPTGAVVLFSGASGWGGAEQHIAQTLAGRGLLVMGFDLAVATHRIAAAQEECVIVIGEIENVSHTLQRALGASAYHFPVLAGIGDGGAFALAVAGQTDAATIDHVVVADPTAAPPPGKTPLCVAGTIADPLPDTALPFTVDAVVTPAADKAGRARIAALADDHDAVTVTESNDAPAAALLATLESASSADSEGLGDLPLIELPVSKPSDIFAVFYSGDGGWRDLDKDLAAILQNEGMPVVGVDSLRYFWKKRSPERTASDLSRIIHAYQHKWNAKRVVLIGFSFGANILPPVFNRLPAADRDSMVQMSLLGLSDLADFEVTVGSFLDKKTKDAISTIPEALKIDPRRLQCFYGREDDEADCTALKPAGVEIVGIDGGHHFDEDYQALARMILDGAKKRKGS